MPDETPPDPRQRLEKVDRGIRDALERRDASRRAEAARRSAAQGTQAAGASWRIMIDLVVATAAGGLIGYGLDALSGLSPLGLLGGLFFGFGCGMWLAVRLARRIQAGAGGGPEQDRS